MLNVVCVSVIHRVRWMLRWYFISYGRHRYRGRVAVDNQSLTSLNMVDSINVILIAIKKIGYLY